MRIVPIKSATKPDTSSVSRQPDCTGRGHDQDEAEIIDQLFTSEDANLSFASLRALFPDKTEAARDVPKAL